MGFLTGLKDTFGFGDGGANDAANQIQAANFAAGNKLNEAFGTTETALQPFADAGANALPGLEAGATPGGLDAILQQIFNTSGFSSLVDQRTQAVQNQLSAGGLVRSGGALLEAARVPTDLGFQIEQMLNQRLQGLVGQGLDTSLNIGNFRSANATGGANIIANTGKANSNSILTGRQVQAAGLENLLKLGSAGVSQFNFGGGGVGGGGGGALNKQFASLRNSSGNFF